MNVLINGELVLSGTVGEDFFGDGFTFVDVLLALAQVSGDLTVRLNSGGGIATEGVAIYNALAQYKGRITVKVEGLAASAASIIAMAGDEIIMGRGALMMIHDPLVYAAGNADDMTKIVEMLNAMGDAMATIYADRTGKTTEEARADMREEIWMTAEEAVAKGYADKIGEDQPIPVAAFDYRAYSKAPATILALSDANNWSNRLKARMPKVPKSEQDTMTTKPEATPAPAPAPVPAPAPEGVTPEAAVKAEQERATAIMDVCFKANVPSMASAFIRDGFTVEQATEKVKAEASRSEAIKAKVEQARKMHAMVDATLADAYIASGMSAEAAGDDLLNRIATLSASTPTRGSHNATPPTDQANVSASWDKIVAKINSARGFNG
jgi:ATP-dependent protease ClpP protease subunit